MHKKTQLSISAIFKVVCLPSFRNIIPNIRVVFKYYKDVLLIVFAQVKDAELYVSATQLFL